MNVIGLLHELVHTVGKLAVEMGEEWRLQHSELMDAYQAAVEFLNKQ